MLVATLALVALARATQPGALDLYPPTSRGRFENVPVDHSRSRSRSRRFAALPRARRARAWRAAPGSSRNEGAIEAFYNATGAMFESRARAWRASSSSSTGTTVGRSRSARAARSLRPGCATHDRAGARRLCARRARAAVADRLPRARSQRVRRRCSAAVTAACSPRHRLKYPHLGRRDRLGAPVDFYPQEHAQRVFRAAYERTYAEHGGDARGGRAARRAACAAARRRRALAAAGVRACAARRARKTNAYFEGALSSIAMVDYPYATDFLAPLPPNPVRAVREPRRRARADDEAAATPRSEPARLLAALNEVAQMFVNATGALACFDFDAELFGVPRAGTTTTTARAAAW